MQEEQTVLNDKLNTILLLLFALFALVISILQVKHFLPPLKH